jgi:hypothetical protein
VQKFKPQKKKKKKKKRLIVACVFECFQSHILEELHEFLHMIGAMIIFRERVFIFSFVVMKLVTKLIGLGAHLRR